MVASPGTEEKQMPLVWMLAVGTALALQPPVGWTALGPDRAALMASDPGRGEVLEMRVDGSSIEPLLLVTALGQQAMPVHSSSRAADGTVSIRFSSGKLGRARVHTSTTQVTWYVVVVDEAHAGHLDADALLASLVPRPRPAALQGQVEVMPAGRDGSLWDVVEDPQPQPAASTDIWGNTRAAAPSAWGLASSLVGVWGGTVGGPWA